MSEVSRGEHSASARAHLRELDRELGDVGAFSDPATFAHDIARTYLMCAGDFLSGMQYVIAPETNLHFSSSSLARATCEYANRASWMAEPGITDRQRTARGIAIFQDTVREEGPSLEPTMRSSSSAIQKSTAGEPNAASARLRSCPTRQRSSSY
jgi:hypothetical protein